MNKDNYKEILDNYNKAVLQIEIGDNKTLKGVVSKLKSVIEEKNEGCDKLLGTEDVLKVGIVGQVKAGKSSFLNSVFFGGNNILPRASTPMTAGLTILKSGESNKLLIEYFNKKEWKYFLDMSKEYDSIVKSEMTANPNLRESEIEIPEVLRSAHELVEKKCPLAESKIKEESLIEEEEFLLTSRENTENAETLHQILEKYVGADGDFTAVVKSLTLQLDQDIFPELKGIQIVDTPGVNDPVVSREARTRDFLKECHGVFFLSNSCSFFGSEDVKFLEERIGSEGIGSVVLLASMFDAGLMDISNKYPDDLANAVTHLKRALEGQFNTNISSSKYKGNKPLLDFTSGISYSISHKTTLDEMESHVVKRMEKLYPSFFPRGKETIEMFDNLSNIDDITKRYLEGVFKQNKDKIINEKISKYFDNAEIEIRNSFKNEIEKIEAMLQGLKDNKDLSKQKKLINQMLENLKGGMQSIISMMDSRKDQAIKETLNNFHISWDGRIPTTREQVQFHRLSTVLDRNKYFTLTVEKVSEIDTVNMVNKVVRASVEPVITIWDKKMSELRNFLNEEISQYIKEQAESDKEGNINTKLLYSILKTCLESLKSVSTLDMNKLYDQVNKGISTALQGSSNLKIDYGSQSESSVKHDIQSEVESNKRKASDAVSNYINNLSNDIRRIIEKAGDEAIDPMKKSKDKFVDSIKQELEKSLRSLEEELKDKEKNLKLYNNALGVLNNVR